MNSSGSKDYLVCAVFSDIYRINTDLPRILSTTADVETFLLSLPRNGIDDQINNEGPAPRSSWFITLPTPPAFSWGCWWVHVLSASSIDQQSWVLHQQTMSQQARGKQLGFLIYQRAPGYLLQVLMLSQSVITRRVADRYKTRRKQRKRRKKKPKILCLSFAQKKACERRRWGFRAARSSRIPASAPGSVDRRVSEESLTEPEIYGR